MPDLDFAASAPSHLSRKRRARTKKPKKTKRTRLHAKLALKFKEHGIGIDAGVHFCFACQHAVVAHTSTTKKHLKSRKYSSSALALSNETQCKEATTRINVEGAGHALSLDVQQYRLAVAETLMLCRIPFTRLLDQGSIYWLLRGGGTPGSCMTL
jgi:hypothetical protein